MLTANERYKKEGWELVAVKTPFTLLFRLKAKKKIAQIRRRFIGASVTALLTETINGKLLVPVDDLSVARHLAHNGKYEQDHTLALKRLISAESKVLVVGTHVGAILIPLAQKCSQVVGIEANPDISELLKKNILLNGLDNVTTYQMAAWDSDGEVDFLKSSINSGGSKVDTGSRRAEFHYDKPSRCRVWARRLDDVLPKHSFDLIIVDIEGAEYRALKGMPDLLSQTRHLLIEILPNHIENVARVNQETFSSAIPPHLKYASILGKPITYERSEFPTLLHKIWASSYFSGVDVLFSGSPVHPNQH